MGKNGGQRKPGFSSHRVEQARAEMARLSQEHITTCAKTGQKVFRGDKSCNQFIGEMQSVFGQLKNDEERAEVRTMESELFNGISVSQSNGRLVG